MLNLQWTVRFAERGKEADGWISDERGIEVFELNPLAFDDPSLSATSRRAQMLHALNLAAASPDLFASLSELLDAIIEKTDLGLAGNDVEMIGRAEAALARVTGYEES